MFAYCRCKKGQNKAVLQVQSVVSQCTNVRGNKKISLHSGRAGSWRGLVGQSQELLIYTFHKTIHVRGIPLPIWLVRTRVGGVFMELESRQEKKQQWVNNNVASFPYMQISGLPLSAERNRMGLVTLKKKYCTVWLFIGT